MAVVVFLGLMALLRGPEFVDHVIVDNRTAQGLTVSVTDGKGGRLLSLTTTEPNRPSRIEDVIEQGETWEFVVTRAGEAVARIRLTRHELESTGWRVVLSDAVLAAAATASQG